MAVDATISSFSFEMLNYGTDAQPDEPIFHIAYHLKDDVLGDLGIRVVRVQEDDVVDAILDILDAHVQKIAKASNIPQIKVRQMARKAERQVLRAKNAAKMPQPTSKTSAPTLLT